jgi:hypothetical protein
MKNDDRVTRANFLAEHGETFGKMLLDCFISQMNSIRGKYKDEVLVADNSIDPTQLEQDADAHFAAAVVSYIQGFLGLGLTIGADGLPSGTIQTAVEELATLRKTREEIIAETLKAVNFDATTLEDAKLEAQEMMGFLEMFGLLADSFLGKAGKADAAKKLKERLTELDAQDEAFEELPDLEEIRRSDDRVQILYGPMMVTPRAPRFSVREPAEPLVIINREQFVARHGEEAAVIFVDLLADELKNRLPEEQRAIIADSFYDLLVDDPQARESFRQLHRSLVLEGLNVSLPGSRLMVHLAIKKQMKGDIDHTSPIKTDDAPEFWSTFGDQLINSMLMVCDRGGSNGLLEAREQLKRELFGV